MTCKFKIQYVAGFFLFFTCLQSFAQTYRLNGNYYVYNSSDDLDTGKRKLGPLSVGSEFSVVSTLPARNNKEILEIEVTKFGGKTKLDNNRYWIYKGKNSDFSELNNSSSPKTEAGCEDCDKIPIVTQDPNLTRNSENLADISQFIENGKHQPAPQSEAGPKVGNLDQQIENYSNSSEVASTINWADRNKNTRSTRKCYRKVKFALAAKDKNGHSLIPAHYPDMAAIGAKESLKKFGFVNLLEIEPYKSQITSPSQAPKGAVLVYSSGLRCGNIKDCGHVEIKMGNKDEPGYVSDYKSLSAINETPAALRFGSRYKLIGVMIKPMENL